MMLQMTTKRFKKMNGLNPRIVMMDQVMSGMDGGEEFRQALGRKNINRILGEEAKAANPQLSAWLLERAGRYDLDGMKKLALI
jgi:hypothetical protein